MRERAGLLRAAWREQWPAATMAFVIAIATWAGSIGGELPGPAGLVLAIAPAALYGGLAVGRSPARMLAFLLARPCTRNRLLAARIELALGWLGLAAILVALPVLVRTPEPGVLLDLVLTGATVVLALACGIVGALATDREPLALGIAVLLCGVMPIAMLLVCEPLGINPARVVAAHPFGVLAAIGLATSGCVGAARRMWCERLPIRDQPAVKRLMLGAGLGWIGAQLLFVGLAWRSAAADESRPMVVLGQGPHGLVVAAGSFGSRVDAVFAGEEVVLDATVRGGGRFENVTRAVTDGERVAVTLLDPDEGCRVVLFDPRHGERAFDERCGRLMLSPSGATLAILRPHEIVYVDTETAAAAPAEYAYEFVVVGWLGEELVINASNGDDNKQLRAGTRVLTDLQVVSARVSPHGGRLAARIHAHGDVRRVRPEDRGPAQMMVLELGDGSSRRFELPITGSRIVGWLDDEHIVVVGNDVDGRSSMLVVAASSGTIVQAIDVELGSWISHVDGPPDGPWLATRGTAVDALDSDGTPLWREYVGTLELDEHDARRWAIVDGEVVGIDRSGRWWRRPIPWEVSQ